MRLVNLQVVQVIIIALGLVTTVAASVIPAEERGTIFSCEI